MSRVVLTATKIFVFLKNGEDEEFFFGCDPGQIPKSSNDEKISRYWENARAM